MSGVHRCILVTTCFKASPKPVTEIVEIPDEPSTKSSPLSLQEHFLEKRKSPVLSPGPASIVKSPTLSPKVEKPKSPKSPTLTLKTNQSADTTSVQELHKAAELKLQQLKDTEKKKRKCSYSGSDSDKGNI